jgi:hypothetical protein
LVAALLRPERRDFTGSKQLPRILTNDIRLPALEERSWQRKNNTTGERPKEKKTKRELEAMARQRLGCAAPVRRDGKGGWYFQVIEASASTLAHFSDGRISRRRAGPPL